ncbi:glycosyltransferase [Georgenia sp. AZ-5]|uniref:glycosyltransferase n=1 Tax=Georgenia sp. AZ-5 TaxID=3367526 RepID=UPI003754A58D
MRVLAAFAGGLGHYRPIAPLARALAAAGHEVRVACQASAAARVGADGLAVVRTRAETAGSVRMSALLPPDPDREDRALREGYAGRTARSRAHDVLAECRRRRPDVVLCDEVDFGAMVAAERLGIPHATVLVMAAGSFVREDVVGEPLRALRAEHGLPDEPPLAMLGRHLVLSPAPPGFRDPAFPLPATARPLRPSALDAAATTRLGTGRPLVYFSLGTVFNLESGDLFGRVLAGLRDLPADVLVSLGADLAPALLGPQPANVRVEPYVDQHAVLARADAVVTHGGSGTVTDALALGVPLVLLPLGADQPHNARRCADLGVGVVLDPVTVTAAQVRRATATVLADPVYRRRAQALRAETAALPEVGRAVSWLEALAR